MTSASHISARASLAIALNGSAKCAGWSVGNIAPCLRSVNTQAPSRSASRMRGCQYSSLREPRPNRISGFFAFERSATISSSASFDGRGGFGGWKRFTSGHSGSLSSARLLEAGVEARCRPARSAPSASACCRAPWIPPAHAAEVGWSSHLMIERM